MTYIKKVKPPRELQFKQADRLKLLRETMGIKQSALCLLVGQNQGNYSKMEAGYKMPSDDIMLFAEKMFVSFVQEKKLKYSEEINRLVAIAKDNYFTMSPSQNQTK